MVSSSPHDADPLPKLDYGADSTSSPSAAFVAWGTRLVDRLRRLPGPVIQVWGWPGSGRRRLLRHLARLGARELPPAALQDPALLVEAAGDAWREGLPYLLCRAFPLALAKPTAAETLDELMLDPPLVVATATPRSMGEGTDSLLDPWELLLTETEMAALWHEEAGRPLSSQGLDALSQATDGWLEIALLTARHAPVGFAPSAEAVARLPAVEHFLVERVLPALGEPLVTLLRRVVSTATPSSDLRESLLAMADSYPTPEASMSEIPMPGISGDSRGGGGPWHRLAHHHGLVLADAAGARLPAVLAAHLRGNPLSVSTASPRPAAGLADGVEASEVSALVDAAEPSVADAVATFELRLLGPPALLRTDADPPEEVAWTLRRSLLLLAFLALAPGRRARRDELAEAIFPGEDAEIIRKNFHPTLSHLRRDLGAGRGAAWSGVEYSGGVYRLDPRARWRLDIELFESLVTSGRAAVESLLAPPSPAGEEPPDPLLPPDAVGPDATLLDPLRQAWALYAGPFLPGVDAHWAQRRRESLHRTYLDLLRTLATAAETLQRPVLALDAWRAFLLEDPLEEAIHVSVMTHYARRGRRDLVRRQYERLTQLLQDELGVGPLPETTRAYHRLIS